MYELPPTHIVGSAYGIQIRYKSSRIISAKTQISGTYVYNVKFGMKFTILTTCIIFITLFNQTHRRILHSNWKDSKTKAWVKNY